MYFLMIGMRRDKKCCHYSHLHSHHDIGRFVENFLDSAIVASAEFFVEFQLVHADVKRGAIGKVDARGMEDGFAFEIEFARRVT